MKQQRQKLYSTLQVLFGTRRVSMAYLALIGLVGLQQAAQAVNIAKREQSGDAIVQSRFQNCYKLKHFRNRLHSFFCLLYTSPSPRD